MIKIKIVINILGVLLGINGVLMLVGLPFSIYYGSDDILAILFASGMTITTGLAMWGLTRNINTRDLGRREGYLIVTLGWVIMSFFGSLPFLFSGAIPNFTDAFFETISGYTTTGASILNNIESLPKGILLWRSMTHWIGGMGIIVLSLAILPILGVGGMQLFIAEVPGPTPDKINPRVTGTAKRLWFIYVLLTVSEIVLLMLGGLNLFDAINHAFATMATGGFSTKQDSIAFYNDNPFAQYVIMLFMYLAGVNFSLHYYALKRRFQKVWGNEEFRVYTGSILMVAISLAGGLSMTTDFSLEESFRHGLFTVLTIVTTTGFVTVDYEAWVPALTFLVFMLMFTGGSAGSTGGGIKTARIILLIKNSFIELKRLVHPRAVIPVRLNGEVIPLDVMSKVLSFFMIYMLTFIMSSFIMSCMGLDFISAMGSVITSLGNIGPGFGIVGPVSNYAEIPSLGKWFLSFLMLLGRLELFTVVILFAPAFWRK